MSNFISDDINPKSIEEIVDLIKSIKDKMPYLTDLDSSSQLLLPKLQEAQVPFVEKCLKHAKNVPEIAPAFIEVAEFEKAFTLFNELQTVLTELNKVTELVNSTIAVTGSDAYVAAVSIFKSVRKNADNDEIPQIRSMLFDLNKSYDSLGKAKPPIY